MVAQKSSKKLLDAPWITSDGCFDPTRFPIDSVLKQALAEDPSKVRSACCLLGQMASHGRTEAAVFLMGLLRYWNNDLKRLSTIVEHLAWAETEASADALVEELKRVKSSNTTRAYLADVTKALSRHPAGVAKKRFVELSEDRGFSQKMRAKFRYAAEECTLRQL